MHRQKLKELPCPTCQGGQLELGLSLDTETEVQGSVPSSVSALLAGLSAFGVPEMKIRKARV